MELVTLGVVLGMGFMKGAFKVLEAVHAGLESQSTLKGSFLLEIVGNRVESSRKLKQFEGELRRREKPRFSDVCEAYNQFLRVGDATAMSEAKLFVEKSISTVNEILAPLSGPKFITEL